MTKSSAPADIRRAWGDAFRQTLRWLLPSWIAAVAGVVIVQHWYDRAIVPALFGSLLLLGVSGFFSLLRVFSLMESRRPFELNPDGLLLYRGRRNVAFGVDTINETLRRLDATQLRLSGLAAGRRFATAFDHFVSDRRDHHHGVVGMETVISWWREYDESAGFGRMQPVLTQNGGAVQGRIEYYELFTTHNPPPGASPLCLWMEGYLEGFLNSASILGGGGQSVATVVHAQCGGGDSTYPCVFEVRRGEATPANGKGKNDGDVDAS